MKKLTVLGAVFFALIFFLNSCAAQSGDPFRLHVIANSDSAADQSVKLKVRDALLALTGDAAANCADKADFEDYVCENIGDIEETALSTLSENGFDYGAQVSVGNFYFPEKSYGDVTYPAGFYDGVKVELGSAEGQNWWCVMFPPLCLFADGKKNGKIVYKSIFEK